MRKSRQTAGSLADRAYQGIRDKILKGELPLGAAISRRRLADEFGVSFLPVSEAIQRLEEEGLVESQPRVGTRVRIPTPQDLRERYIMREALEVQSARLFAEKASSDERLELRSMAARLDALTGESADGQGDQQFFFKAQMYHLTFHMRIAECTGCTALCEAIHKNQVLIFNWLYDAAADFHMPPRWHQDLIQEVAGNSPDAADVAMRRHVRHGMEEIQAQIAFQFSKPALELGRIQKAGGWRVKNGRR